MDVRATKLATRDVPDKFVEKLKIDSLMWRDDDVGAFGGVDFGPVRDLYDSADDILSSCAGRGIAIQAGGNCGLYARWYALHFNRVFTFEPTGESFVALAANSVNAPRKNIFCFNAGLGDSEGYASCHDHTGDNCGADRYTPIDQEMLYLSGTQDSAAPLVRLDDIALSWGKVDIIHLDIEGMEEYAIRGAGKLIQRDHPVVILEVPNTDTKKMLADWGYQFHKKIHSDEIYLFKG